jgi:tetratricopeptide (TPR) repeat protein
MITEAIVILVSILCLNLQVCYGNMPSYQKQSRQSQHNTGVSRIDTSMINQLNANAYQYRRSKPDTALYLAQKALDYSLAIDYKKGIGNAYLTLGYTHLMNYSKNDSASIYMRKAYKIFRESNDLFGMGMVNFGMGYVYSFKGNMKESENYMKKSLQLFKKIHHQRGLYNAYNSLAYIYQQYKNYDTAFYFIQQAIKTATEIGDSMLIADANNNLGNIYKDQYLLQQAIDVYFKALKLWELKSDTNGMAIAYGNIGLMYYFQKDYAKALEYYKKKLPVSVKAKNKWEESRTYNDIGFVHLALSNFDTALYFYQKALVLNNNMNYPPGIAESYYDIANTYLMMQVYDSAKNYALKSIDIAEKISAAKTLAADYILLGKIYFAYKDYSHAASTAFRGYQTGKKFNIPDIISEGSDLLSRIYSFTGRYDLAYKYLMEFKQMQDSINIDENSKKITRLELQYEFDKMQRKIDFEQEQERIMHEAELRQQKLYLHGAVILIVFIIITGILVIRQRSLHSRIKTIDLEQKLLRVQMNPHFIFNSLCAVQDYILNNKPKEANVFLSRFASLMRAILETSRQDFVLLEKEIEVLKHYIEIQKTRFETDFNYTFKIDENIGVESVAIPPMLAQPFIENSIEHGLLPKKEKGQLKLYYSIEQKLMKIIIEDDGIGRQKSAKMKANSKKEKHSLAIQLTKERIEFLKKTLNKKTEFRIEDIHENDTTGTRVIFKVPYRYGNN